MGGVGWESVRSEKISSMTRSENGQMERDARGGLNFADSCTKKRTKYCWYYTVHVAALSWSCDFQFLLTATLDSKGSTRNCVILKLRCSEHGWKGKVSKHSSAHQIRVLLCSSSEKPHPQMGRVTCSENFKFSCETLQWSSGRDKYSTTRASHFSPHIRSP